MPYVGLSIASYGYGMRKKTPCNVMINNLQPVNSLAPEYLQLYTVIYSYTQLQITVFWSAL